MESPGGVIRRGFAVSLWAEDFFTIFVDCICRGFALNGSVTGKLVGNR